MKNLFSILLLFFAASAFCQVVSTDEQLTNQANVIRNETSAKGNSKTRIANMYQAIIDSKVNRNDSIPYYLISGKPTFESNKLFYQLLTPSVCSSCVGTLYSYTIPAGTLSSDGEKLYFNVFGSAVGPGGESGFNILVRLDGTTIFSQGFSGLQTTDAWSINGIIVRSSSSAQKIFVSVNCADVDSDSGTTVSGVFKKYTAGSADLSTALDLEIIVEANITVTGEYLEVIVPN